MLFEFARRYSESAWARVVTAKRVHRALSKFARSRSEGALTRAILAEGSLGMHFTNLHGATASALGRAGSLQGFTGTFQIRTASQRGRFDTRNPRRGFIGHFTNLHGATARALGRAGSLQRVRRAQHEHAKRGER